MDNKLNKILANFYLTQSLGADDYNNYYKYVIIY
jgi:hypothetical protein